MGHFLTKILNSFSDMKAKILMLGLDGAGKTTILYQMKLSQAISSVPTVGFSVEEIQYRGLSFTVWDIGGQTRLRNLWHHYYKGSDALIYVLDSSDTQRIEEAREILRETMGHDEMTNVPVLVFANKMDVTSLTTAEIVDKLGLPHSRRNWHLQPCCGLNGEGIVQGFEWLRTETKNNKK